MSYDNINLVECPRDAIQGIERFISTDKKAIYINELIKSNYFEYIDFGSFVSPKAVPQMRDTVELLDKIHKINNTKLLAIVANERGADTAITFDKIDYIGYPFSISETFQQRNANSSIAQSFERVKYINDKIISFDKEMVVYISMAFGNPYGDHWDEDIVLQWLHTLQKEGIKRFSIADTTGEANEITVKKLFKRIKKEFSKLDFSVHLHSEYETALKKINAAYEGGCMRFEGAFLGYGGCPFAKDDLVGNIPSELLLERFSKASNIDIGKLKINFYEMIS